MKRLLLGLILLTSVYTVKAQTDTVPSRYVAVTLDMPQLHRQRRIQIFLPADYYTLRKKYPVLYMQDAQNIYSKNGQAKNSWRVDSLLNTLPADKQAIIVGIDHGGSLRIGEYDPWDSKYAKGEGSAYTEFMVKTLKPYIDAHYRTRPDARHTAIAGSSMGALIALYATLKYPGIYNNAGLFSGAFWIAPDIYRMTSDAGISNKHGFFLSCGDAEGDHEAEDMAKMDSTLRSRNLSIKSVPDVLILQGEKHNEHQWALSFPAFYSWWVKRW